jgi:hypothetical protein
MVARISTANPLPDIVDVVVSRMPPGVSYAVNVSGETACNTCPLAKLSKNPISQNTSVATTSGTAFLLNFCQAQDSPSPTLYRLAGGPKPGGGGK